MKGIAAVQHDLCGVLREAEGEEIVIRRRAKPAGIAGRVIHRMCGSFSSTVSFLNRGLQLMRKSEET